MTPDENAIYLQQLPPAERNFQVSIVQKTIAALRIKYPEPYFEAWTVQIMDAAGYSRALVRPRGAEEWCVVRKASGPRSLMEAVDVV